MPHGLPTVGWLITGLTGVGLAGLVTGVVWMHQIGRGDPEPEANDRHWWSRA